MASAMSQPGDRQVVIATISSTSDIDHAIARLVLAFASDPVARWMYDDPYKYLLHIPRLFRALGAGSFEAGAAQRTSDGLGVALWFPPGVRGDDGQIEAVCAENIASERQGEVGSVLGRAEHDRAGEPRWYSLLVGLETLQRDKG